MEGPIYFRRFGRFVIVSTALCAVLTIIVTLSSVHFLPTTTFRPWVGHMFPEGWKLFTADPQLPRFHVAAQRNGRWVDADELPLARPSNAFGLKKAVRWQAVEVARLVNEVPDLDAWTPCRGEPLRCLARAERRVHAVPNPTPYKSLCGRIGLIRDLIVPIEDRPRGDGFQTTHVVVLNVRC